MTAKKTLMTTLIALCLMFIGISSAIAEDVLYLKDGRVLRGQVVREVDDFIFFRYKLAGIEQESLFSAAQYDRLERDAKAIEVEMEADRAEPEKAREYQPGVPRVAVITLGEGGGRDMVGIYMTAKALRDAIPLLEDEGVTDVVLHINSSGGLLLEIQRLSDVIHEEYKPRFRTVAWIESAISAAAMTAHCLDEIYFKSEGTYGACTGWSGQLDAVEGRTLEEVLYMMERISDRGNHSPYIMAAMQVLERPLSCTINEQTGQVTWYQDLSGEIIVNESDRILTFNAPMAERTKFSKGTADTLDELAALMGYEEVEWVGEERRGYTWPISKAEEEQMRFRTKTADDQRRTAEYINTYMGAIGRAQGSQDRETRGKFVNRARKSLNQIDRMIKNNPNLSFMTLNMMPQQYDRWLEEQYELLRELMR